MKRRRSSSVTVPRRPRLAVIALAFACLLSAAASKGAAAASSADADADARPSSSSSPARPSSSPAEGPWCTSRPPATATAASNTVSLYLAATNDIHNRVDQADPLDGGACPPEKARRGVCAGGFARLATFFKQARSRAADACAAALVADAGDQTTGQAWDAVYRQSETAGLMRAAGYDVTTLGNHEFDFTLETLDAMVGALASSAPPPPPASAPSPSSSEAGGQGGGGGGGGNGQGGGTNGGAPSSTPIPMLGACSIASYGDPSGSSAAAAAASASLAKTVRRHHVRSVVVPGLPSPAPAFLRRFFPPRRAPVTLRIGFVGYVVASTARTQSAAKNLTFVPDAEAAARCARELRAAEPALDAVVALSHLGYDADVALAPSLLGLVDVVIGGHSHTFLSNEAGGPIWDAGATTAAAETAAATETATEAAGDGGTKKVVPVTSSTCAAARACDVPQGPYPTIVSGPSAAAGEGDKDKEASLPIFQARFASIYANLLRLDFALPALPAEATTAATMTRGPLGRRGGATAAEQKAAAAAATTTSGRPRLVAITSATGGSPALLGGPGSSNPVAEDADMLARIAARRAPVDALAAAPVGVALPPGGLALGDARRAESPLGTYLCGAMLRAARNGGSAVVTQPPDACLVTAGALRQGIPAGPVARADVASAHPYGNTVAARRVSAAALVVAAKHGLKGVSVGSGGFPQVEGLRLYIDCYGGGDGGGSTTLDGGDGGGNATTLDNPAFVALYLLPPPPPASAGARRGTGGSGVGVELRAGDASTTLLLVSTNYLFGGGDGYDLPPAPGAPQPADGGGALPSVADALAARIADDTSSVAGGASASAVDPRDPRIVDCAAARRVGRCAGAAGVYGPCCRGGGVGEGAAAAGSGGAAAAAAAAKATAGRRRKARN